MRRARSDGASTGFADSAAHSGLDLRESGPPSHTAARGRGMQARSPQRAGHEACNLQATRSAAVPEYTGTRVPPPGKDCPQLKVRLTSVPRSDPVKKSNSPKE